MKFINLNKMMNKKMIDIIINQLHLYIFPVLIASNTPS